ncbi:MAG: hypothetical protein GW748_01575 [Alphaproteobacteria bacterium]|nr:hypothetical protein [Alphaproteobacteria bacterium]NCQ66421.1 hypothetical protein [Alphaproteobacteria bacterium]
MKIYKIYALLISALLIENTSASLIGNGEIPDTSNDEFIALSLSNNVIYNDKPWMPVIVRKSYNAYDIDVQKKVRNNMDVHQFNAVTGLKGRLPLLISEDEFTSDDHSFETTRSLLETSEDYAVFNKKNVLKLNLDRLKIHLETSKVELKETGTNVEALFSRVWSLAAANPDFAQQLFLSICDNSETGGGCYPGHAGRLARLYVNFLRGQWLE